MMPSRVNVVIENPGGSKPIVIYGCDRSDPSHRSLPLLVGPGDRQEMTIFSSQGALVIEVDD